MDIFGGSSQTVTYIILNRSLSQNWTILGSFLCILGSFLKAKVQNGGYFLGC